MTTNNEERDFGDFESLPYGGLIVPELFNNTGNAGDGWPGSQRTIRNWTKKYLSGGAFEHDLDINTYDITGDASNISGFETFNSDQITGISGLFGIIDMSSNKINNLANGSISTDAMALGQKYTNANAVSAMGAKADNNSLRHERSHAGKESNTLVYSNDTERAVNNLDAPATKVKEIICYRSVTGCRVYWEFKHELPATAISTWLYLNGVVVSPEEAISSAGNYDSATYDLTGLNYGDLIQVYAFVYDNLSEGYIRNMRIKYDEFASNDP